MSNTSRIASETFTVWTRDYGNVDVITAELGHEIESIMDSLRAQLDAVTRERDEAHSIITAAAREPFTYTSKQSTECAGCGIRKHTPLRRDEMGGYVCLTCIDKELDTPAVSAQIEQLQAELAEARQQLAAQAQSVKRLKDGLVDIAAKAAHWNANELGGVKIQRQRWLKLGEIARAAIAAAMKGE